MLYEKDGSLSCPLNWAMSVINGKWKPYIIWYLGDKGQPARYSELKRTIPFDISHKVFSQQLKELVRDGIVSRLASIAEDRDNTLQVEYTLTPQGTILCSILYLLRDWGSLFGHFDDPVDVFASGKGQQISNMRVYSMGSHETAKDDGDDFIIWVHSKKPASVDGGEVMPVGNSAQ